MTKFQIVFFTLAAIGWLSTLARLGQYKAHVAQGKPLTKTLKNFKASFVYWDGQWTSKFPRFFLIRTGLVLLCFHKGWDVFAIYFIISSIALLLVGYAARSVFGISTISQPPTTNQSTVQ